MPDRGGTETRSGHCPRGPGEWCQYDRRGDPGTRISEEDIAWQRQ